MVELFSGIGAQASALERLNIPHQSVISEINPQAYSAYCAIHGPTDNIGDITKVEHLPECDILTYSPPCQDISIAGKGAGLVEGSQTRSSLIWEVERLLKDCKEMGRLPEVLVMENVDAILNKRYRPHLERFIIQLNKLGYDSSYTVLNSKDFGVPQNRSRFYMVSALKKHYIFPNSKPLNICLKDVLEKNVDESYYLTEEKIKYFTRRNNQSKEVSIVGSLNIYKFEQSSRVYGIQGISPTICTAVGSDHIPKIEVTDYDR